MAFQPIVDFPHRTVYAYEALVRGPNGEAAASVLAQVTAANRYAFDQNCRVRAIETAAALGLPCKLSVNFLPNAVHHPEACLRLTLATAERCGMPVERIMFELIEDERSSDILHLSGIFREYRRQGFITAIDDFGSGYAGLELIAAFPPDVIKLAMELVRGIDTDRVRRAIVANTVALCTELDILVIAEGVETAAERRVLSELGIDMFQGHLFARAAVGTFPTVNWEAAA